MRELFKVNEKKSNNSREKYFLLFYSGVSTNFGGCAKRSKTEKVRRTISSVCNVLYYFENSGCAIKISFRGDKIKKEIVTSR